MVDLERAALLLLLRDSLDHGYRLFSRLRHLGLPGQIGNLYRTLKAMEEEGMVVGAWEMAAAGPARKVYAITDAGRAALDAAIPAVAAHYQALCLTLDAWASTQ